MPAKNAPLFALLLWGSLVFVGCNRCETEDDETLLRGIIDRAAKLAEEHDVKELMRLAAKDFQASPGAQDRNATRGMLFMAFQRYGKFSVRFPRPTVNVDQGGAHAEASTPFLIVRDGQGLPDLSDLYNDPDGWVEQLGSMADPYHLELWFVKKDGDWLVRKARIQGLKSIDDL